MTVRPATPADAASIARIYNEGIADRVATFETRLRTPEDVAQWFDGVHPIVAVEDERGLIAFGATFTYRPRECYRGIAEASLYVAREARRQGVGRVCMTALIEASRKARPLEARLAHLYGEHRQPRLNQVARIPRGRDL